MQLSMFLIFEEIFSIFTDRFISYIAKTKLKALPTILKKKTIRADLKLSFIGHSILKNNRFTFLHFDPFFWEIINLHIILSKHMFKAYFLKRFLDPNCFFQHYPKSTFCKEFPFSSILSLLVNHHIPSTFLCFSPLLTLEVATGKRALQNCLS